jgi:glyoxylase-like metal-dependent hydrolase (beta-lactamase superfamily II)
MPDQGDAATEHSIMQEITAPLANLPQDPLASVASHDFPVVLRGYDRVAVDEYVKRTTQLVAELHATRSPEGAVRRALERVGEEVSTILQRAHDTAERITSTSRAEAEERLIRARDEAEQLDRSARQQAVEIEQAARRRVHELDADVDRIWAERDRIVADVRKLSEDLELLAGAAATRFPAAAAEEPEAILEEPESDLEEEPEVALSGDAAVAYEPPPGEQPTAIFEESFEELDEPAPAVEGDVIRLIDLLHLGRERVIGCWQVDDVLIDPGPASCLPTLLEALGDESPRALLLTHIHLDHAGATGSLVARWPEIEVYVHERGAPHIMDPSRLLESARRLYGDDMDRLWGEVQPVPSANMRLLRGGEHLLGGSFEVAYTPGHASHHVSYLHDGIAFVGDVGGVRITPQTLTVPPTPPPDIDLEAWHSSIDLLAGWNPDVLAMTHFGSSDAVQEQLAELSERMDTWAALARTEDLDTFVNTIHAEIEADAGPELLPAYLQAAPPEQLYKGLERYWRTREEAGQTTQERAPLPRDGGPGQSPASASTHAGRSSQTGSS